MISRYSKEFSNQPCASNYPENIIYAGLSRPHNRPNKACGNTEPILLVYVNMCEYIEQHIPS